MKLSDILYTSPRAYALVIVPGCQWEFELPNRPRDWHPMPWLQRQFVGADTPGMTWRNGIAIQESCLARMSPLQILETMLHETVHWWDLWRRMGPTDFPATYGWQGLLRLLRSGSAHLHDTHPQEIVARLHAQLMISDAVSMKFPMTIDGYHDVEAWLQERMPVKRTLRIDMSPRTAA